MTTSNNINGANGWHQETTKRQGIYGRYADNNQESGSKEVSLHSEPKQNNLFDQAINSLKEFANFSSLLRIFGAIAVLASMSMFLMQGWSDTNDFERFCMMIGQTFLLGVGGFAMIKMFKEKKGARLFFGLSLVSVTTNFTTLGALVYSIFKRDDLSVAYPDFALWQWQVDSTLTAMLSVGIAILFLVPLSLLAFSVLARPAAKQLTLWYTAMNLLLLIPVRETAVIMLLVGVAGLGLMQLFLSKKNRLIDLSLFTWKTQEGRYARLILFVPLVIMLARSSFYEFGAVADLITLVSIYLVASFLPKMVEYKIAIWGYIVAIVVSAIIALCLVSLSSDLLLITSELARPLLAVILGALTTDLVVRSKNTWAQNIVKAAGALIVTLALMINHLEYLSLVSALSILLAAGIMIFASIKMADRLLLALGVVLALTLGVSHAGWMTDLVIGSGWIGFAIAGVSVIVLASMLDRYGAIIKLKLAAK